jgi:hypothetical protein
MDGQPCMAAFRGCVGGAGSRALKLRRNLRRPQPRPMPNMYAYLESRVADDRVGPQGEEGYDVFTIGVHYGFSVKGFHRR